MRRRMVFSTLVVTVIAVMLLGLPLGALTYQLIHEEAARQLQGEAELIGAESDTMLESEGTIDTTRFDQDYPQRYIRVSPSEGSEPVTAGDPALSPDALEATETLHGSTSTAFDTQVEVWASSSGYQSSVIRAWLGIASLSLLAIGVAVGLSMFQRSEEHTSELQSRGHLVCRLLLEKKKLV